MNDKIKIAIGAGVGGCVGWFIGAVIAEYIVAKEEMERGGYHDSSEFPQDDRKEAGDDHILLKEREMGKKSKQKNNEHDYTGHFVGNRKIGLAELAKKYGVPGAEKITVEDETGDEITVEVADEEDFTDIPEDPDTMRPVIISLREFIDNQEELEVVQLEYYDDDVVVDTKDNPISKPEQLLGDEALLCFGQESEDEDVVYIRNRSKKAIYEVVRLNKNYGVDPEPQPKRRTPLSKREDNDDSTTGNT